MKAKKRDHRLQMRHPDGTWCTLSVLGASENTLDWCLKEFERFSNKCHPLRIQKITYRTVKRSK